MADGNCSVDRATPANREGRSSFDTDALDQGTRVEGQ